MPRYAYIAKTDPQKAIQGNIEAESQQAAINKLNRLGYFPISVQLETMPLDKQNIWRFCKVSNKDIVLFTRQLSILIASGVNILSSLKIVENQTTNKHLRFILDDVSNKIKDGKSLSESLAIYPRVFSGLYASMIHLGEVGGRIEDALKRLADFLEKEQDFKDSLRSSLIYPAFVFAVSGLTIIILLTFVIPRLVAMFEDMGQVLPLPTKILINISAFMQNYWWFILTVILISIFLSQRTYRTIGGRIFWDRIKLKVPILGKINLKTEIGRIMRTLSLLLSSGMTIIYSLDISLSVIENEILKLQIQKAKDQIAAGASFSKCLQESNMFPAFVINIVTVGEETGTLERSLMRIAEEYEREVDRFLKTLTRLLEPIIILVMGLIVGFIVLSMLLPIFQINLIVR